MLYNEQCAHMHDTCHYIVLICLGAIASNNWAHNHAVCILNTYHTIILGSTLQTANGSTMSANISVVPWAVCTQVCCTMSSVHTCMAYATTLYWYIWGALCLRTTECINMKITLHQLHYSIPNANCTYNDSYCARNATCAQTRYTCIFNAGGPREYKATPHMRDGVQWTIGCCRSLTDC